MDWFTFRSVQHEIRWETLPIRLHFVLCCTKKVGQSCSGTRFNRWITFVGMSTIWCETRLVLPQLGLRVFCHIVVMFCVLLWACIWHRVIRPWNCLAFGYSLSECKRCHVLTVATSGSAEYANVSTAEPFFVSVIFRTTITTRRGGRLGWPRCGCYQPVDMVLMYGVGLAYIVSQANWSVV